MKILNLYACLGGNRYLWGGEHEITAVELDPELARLYKERFPKDNVVVGDAHEYLIKNYKNFEFIWTSPPCPTHSKARFWGSKGGKCEPVYPDMTLYQEIIFLQNFYDGKFCVENVNSYYEPLIPANKRGRHLYWCNFALPQILSHREDPTSKREKNEFKKLCEFHKIDISDYKGEQSKIKIARNLVDYEAGKTILDTATGIVRNLNTTQQKLSL